MNIRQSEQRHFAKAVEVKFLLTTFAQPNALELLQKAFEIKTHPLSLLTHSYSIGLLREFILSYFARCTKELKQAVLSNAPLGLIELELKRLLKIDHKLKLNVQDSDEEDKTMPFLLEILKWAQSFDLIEKLLLVWADSDFSRSPKLFFYYVKHLIIHANSFNHNEYEIKDLLNLQSIPFSFYFQLPERASRIHQNWATLINDPAFLKANFYQIGLALWRGKPQSQNDPVFHAFLLKVRMYLEKDSNAVIRCVTTAHMLFTLIDFDMLRGENLQTRVPQIFILPPDYVEMTREVMQLFFEDGLTVETHVAVLKVLKRLLSADSTFAEEQIQISFNENISLMLKMLNSIKLALKSTDQSATHNSSFLPLRSAQSSEVIQETLKIIQSRTCEEEDAFTSLVDEIAWTIFTKQSVLPYEKDLIELCGFLAVHLEHEENEITRFSLSIEEGVIPYLKTLNHLVASKNSHTRHRRDVAAITRQIAQANIWIFLERHILEEAKNGIIADDSTTMETFKLMSNVCAENPLLIQSVNAACPTILNQLLRFIEHSLIGSSAQSVITIVSFLHAVSMKDGPIRENGLKSSFVALIAAIFTQNKFCEAVSSPNLYQICNQILRFYSNVSAVGKYLMNGLIKALRFLNQSYKQPAELYGKRCQGVTVAEQIELLGYIDSKFAAVLRTMEKVKERIIFAFDGFSQSVLFRILVKLAFLRSIVLVDLPCDSQLLSQLIKDLLDSIKQKPESRLEVIEQEKEEEKEKQEKQDKQEKGEEAIEIENECENSPTKRQAKILLVGKKNKATVALAQEFNQTYFVSFCSLASSLKKASSEHGARRVRAYIELLQDPINSFPQFTIHAFTPKLEIFLAHFLKNFEQKEFEKPYFRQIVRMLPQLVVFYIRQALQCEFNLVKGALQKMSNATITGDSEEVQSRFPFMRLKDDLVRSFLQNNLACERNSYYMILAEIASFCAKPLLTSGDEYFRMYLDYFYHPILLFLADQLNQTGEISMIQVMIIRIALKWLIEPFPQIVNDKNQATMEIIVRYCKLGLSGQFTILTFLTTAMRRLESFDMKKATNLVDSPKSRQLLARKIYVKLASQKILGFLSNFRYDMPINILEYVPDQLENCTLTPVEAEANRKFRFERINYVHKIYLAALFNFYQAINIKVNSCELLSNAAHIVMEKLLLPENCHEPVLLHEVLFRIFPIDEGPRLTLEDHFRILAEFPKNILTWFVSQSGESLHNVTMLAKQALHFDRFYFKSYFNDYKKFLSDTLQTLSEELNLSSLLLRNESLQLGFRVRSLISEDLEVNPVRQIRKVNNIIIFLGQMLAKLIDKNMFSHGDTIIQPAYIIAVFNFASFILYRFEVETHFAEDANLLILTLLHFVRIYLNYKQALSSYKHEISKLKAKDRKNMKKRLIKLEKRMEKNIREDERYGSEANRRSRFSLANAHLEEVSENVFSGQVGLKKEKSRTNLHENSNHSRQGSENAQKKKKGKRRQRAMVSLSMEVSSFVKAVLSPSKPFLDNTTLQYIMKFVFEASSRRLLNVQWPHHFEVYPQQLIQPLLQVRLRQPQMEAYDLLLSIFATQLIEPDQSLIFSETAFKRLFYEHGNNSMPIDKFVKIMNAQPDEAFFMTDSSYLLELQQGQSTRPFNLNKSQLNSLCGDSIKIKTTKVQLKEGCDLGFINYQRKKPLRLIDYMPESGNLGILITQSISSIVKLAIKEISEFIKRPKPVLPTDFNGIEPFNIRTLLNFLQIFIRSNPIFCPMVVRFKCKKIITAELAQLSNELQTKGLFELMSGLNLETMEEMYFMNFVIQVLGPLLDSSITGFVFEACLESIVLVPPKLNTDEQKQPSFPFSRIVSKMVMQSIRSQLTQSNTILNKLSVMSTLTVLFANVEFSKLCIRKHFIQLLYSTYVQLKAELSQPPCALVIKSLANQTVIPREQEKTLLAIFMNKLLIPFFIEPLSLLQQINVTLILHEKNPKYFAQTKIWFYNNEKSLNSQLLPMDAFRKTKFKNDWHFTGCRRSFDLNQEISHFTPDEDSAEEDESDEDGYSLSSNNSNIAGLLNQQIEHNRALFEQANDRIEMVSPFNINGSLSDDFMEGMEEMDSSPEVGSESELNNYESFERKQGNRESIYLNVDHMIDKFSKHLSFHKVTISPLIGKAENNQIYILRMIKQLLAFEQRFASLSTTDVILNLPDTNVEIQIEEHRPMLLLFKNPREENLARLYEWVDMRQSFRYEGNLKKLPLTYDVLDNLVLSEPFLHGFRKRRNGIILPASLNRLDPSQAGEDYANEIILDYIDEDEQEQRRIQAVYAREDLNQEMMLDSPRIEDIIRAIGISPQQFERYAPEVREDIVGNYLRGVENAINFEGQPEEQQEGDEEQQEGDEEQPLSVEFVGGNPFQEMQNLRLGQDNPLNQGRIRIEEGVQERRAERAAGREQEERRETGEPSVHEDYRKMSMEHVKKISKDLMVTVNKEGRNNSRFYEVPNDMLEEVLGIIYIQDESEHINFPFSLLEYLCINTTNESRVIASLIGILHLGPTHQPPESSMLRCSIVTNYGEVYSHYSKVLYPLICLKVLHILAHLTRSYSFSMSMLRVNVNVLHCLRAHMRPEQSSKSSLEMMILLLEEETVTTSSTHLGFLMETLQNITSQHFMKNIHKILEPVKTEGDPEEMEEEMGLALAGASVSIQVDLQSVQLLGGLLQSYFIKENVQVVSQIIMRLSIYQGNMTRFIQYFRASVDTISAFSLREITKWADLSQGAVEGMILHDGFTIVRLLNIFYQMIKSLRAYPTSLDKQAAIMAQFRTIVECPKLKQLCERSMELLLNCPNVAIQSKMGQMLDCYFILYQIAFETYNHPKQEQDNDHRYIAELGEVLLPNNLQKEPETETMRLGDFDLTRFWRENIQHPLFKDTINTSIKKKVFALSHEHLSEEDSLFDLPIVKLATSTTHMLTFQNKRALFKAELKRIKSRGKYKPIHMQINRQEVFVQSFDEIMMRKPEELKGKLKISFTNQEGEDAGGLTRQWYELLSKRMFDANYALFKSGSTGSTYHPSSMSYVNQLHERYFVFVGRITGKALHDGYLLDAYFTPAFYKHILNLPITYKDMEQEDYEYYKSMQWILDNSPIEAYLELNFTYEFDNFGEMQTKELIPNGSEIVVTEENKLQYVQLVSYAKMATNIKIQLERFLEGLHDLIPHRLIRIFDEKELEIMISGRPTIDIEDLKRNTELVNYVKNDQAILWFFEVLESFDMPLRTGFIQFVTGSSRVPVEGFKDLRGMNGVQRFNIHRQFQENSLPRAHTCFNQLDLPSYRTKDIMIEKLKLAITEGKEGFGML